MIKKLFFTTLLFPVLLFGDFTNYKISFHPVEEIFVEELPEAIMDLKFVHSISKLPVVFRGAAKNWPAMNWTPESLEARGLKGIQKVMENRDNPDRITYSLNVGFSKGIGFWKGQRITKQMGTVKSDQIEATSQIEEILKDVNYYEINLCTDINEKDLKLLTDNPSFDLDYSIENAYEYTILAGKEGFQMEIFHDHETSLLAQFYGERMVFLVPPRSLVNEDILIYEMDDVIKDVRSKGIDSLSNIQNGNSFGLQQVILKPGDILYIPSGWYHRVHYLTACLGCAQAIHFDNIND